MKCLPLILRTCCSPPPSSMEIFSLIFVLIIEILHRVWASWKSRIFWVLIGLFPIYIVLLILTLVLEFQPNHNTLWGPSIIDLSPIDAMFRLSFLSSLSLQEAIDREVSAKLLLTKMGSYGCMHSWVNVPKSLTLSSWRFNICPLASILLPHPFLSLVLILEPLRYSTFLCCYPYG